MRTLHGNEHAAVRLDHLRDHVVDETVLVPKALGLKLLPVGGLVDFLEDALEVSVVLLQDGVLGRHVHGQLEVERVLEGGMREARDALGGVVLCLRDAALVLVGELEDLDGFGLAALGCEDHLELAGAFDHLVLGAVLVTESVTADDNGLLPAGHQARHLGDDDGFSEDGAAEVVPDGAVGRQPHLLELELLHALLIGSDGGALDTDAVLLNGLCGVQGDLVVCLIAVGQTKIVVFEVDVEVRVDELVLDVLPDDAGHLVAVKLDDGVLDLDLRDLRRHGAAMGDSGGDWAREGRSGGGEELLAGGEARGEGTQRRHVVRGGVRFRVRARLGREEWQAGVMLKDLGDREEAARTRRAVVAGKRHRRQKRRFGCCRGGGWKTRTPGHPPSAMP